MRIDWIVAIGMFFVLVGVGFQYYSNLFQTRAQPLELVVGDISDSITGFLLADVYEVPVKVSSSGARPDVLYFNYMWPSGGAKNSTRILQGSTGLDCNITDGAVYWQANLIAGDNYFTMRFSNKSVDMNCTDSFSLANANKTIPWVEVKKNMISQSRINEMSGISYSTFKSDRRINRDFRVKINVSGTVTNYGLNPPNATSVYIRETRWALEETDGEVIIRVLTW